MILTTLCYIEKDGAYLMLHRTKKKNDINEGKWIGVGGKFLPGESPEECLVREVREETGLTLTSYRFRGLITFVQEGNDETEYMCLYTAKHPEKRPNEASDTVSDKHGKGRQTDAFAAAMPAGQRADPQCPEGELMWVPKDEVLSLNLWEGDRAFLKLLAEDAPFFTMKLTYRGDTLIGSTCSFV